jgi:thioredoxin
MQKHCTRGEREKTDNTITREITMEHLTRETFKDKIFNYEEEGEWKFRGDLPSVIDFYADWCGPCIMVSPVLEELSREYRGKVNIYKVNTEHEQELAGMFGVSSIPTIIFIPKEGQPQRAVGALPKSAFVQAFRDVLDVH